MCEYFYLNALESVELEVGREFAFVPDFIDVALCDYGSYLPGGVYAFEVVGSNLFSYEWLVELMHGIVEYIAESAAVLVKFFRVFILFELKHVVIVESLLVS